MILIWLLFLSELLVMSMLKPFVADFELASFVAVSVHVFLSIVMLTVFTRRKQRVILLAAFLARIFLMLWDLYARSIFVLPNSGADSEMFYRTAITISENPSVFGNFFGLYPRILGLLFYAIGPQRITAQYLNVLIGLSTIAIIARILGLIRIDRKITERILLLAAFFPTSVILSAILLREAFITLCIAGSLFLYLKWFESRQIRFVFLSLSLLLFASAFHSGSISLLIGYSFGLLFYKGREEGFGITVRSVLYFSIVTSFIVILSLYSSGYFFEHFRAIQDIEDALNIANYRWGGSAYLQGVSVSNIPQLLLFGPLRGFFFLTSPLPMDWRGVADIFSFITDSLLYISTIFLVIKYRRYYGKNKPLVIILMIMIASAALIFGIGVGNAGTAMRHRQKLTPVFLTTIAVIMNSRRERFRLGVEEPSISRL